MVTRKLVPLLLVVVLLSGCASTSATLEKFSGTFEGVCAVWEKLRGHYPELREAAIIMRDLGAIDDKLWESFVWIDSHAADLDRWLSLACAANDANSHVIAKEKASVDWNAVGENVLKVAAFALQAGVL